MVSIYTKKSPGVAVACGTYWNVEAIFCSAIEWLESVTLIQVGVVIELENPDVLSANKIDTLLCKMCIRDSNDIVVVSGMDFVTGVDMEKRYIIYDVLSQLNSVIENFTYKLKKGQIVIDSTYLVGGGDNFDAVILFDILIKMKAIVNRDAIHLIKLAH